jgi:hypothetical protein
VHRHDAETVINMHFFSKRKVRMVIYKHGKALKSNLKGSNRT